MTNHTFEYGRVSGWMIATIGLIVAVLGTGSLAIWAYINYDEAQTDLDGKIALAEAEARREQAEIYEAKFAEYRKEPNRDFVGPDDFGRLTFSYPKTWSVHVSTNASAGGTYEAYLNPGVVPPIENDTRYALRVTIETADYEEVLTEYDSQLEDGALRSSTFSANGENGVRLDGNFDDNIRGAAVIFKIRDKTVTMRTDADTFKPDFEKLIKTISFNQ